MNETEIVFQNIRCRYLNGQQNDISLFYGCCGDILLLSDLFRQTKEERFRDLINCYIDQILSQTNNINRISLSSGICGILYSLISVKDIANIDLPDLTEYDNIIRKYVNQSLTNSNYDLQSGLIGYGVFYLKLSEHFERYNDFVIEICHMICNLLIVKNDKISLSYHAESHPIFPKDALWTNNGFLHGINSVIAFFLICIGSGLYSQRIIDTTLNLLNNEILLFDDKMESFPMAYMYGPKSELILDKRRSKLHFCTGDYGIILNFINAHEIFSKYDYLFIAKKSYERILRRRQAGETITKPCFCHGKASLLYFAERFKHLSNVDNDYSEIEYLEIVETLKEAKDNKADILNGDNGINMAILSRIMVCSLERILLLR